MAERHVVEGEARVLNHRRLIEHMKHQGLDTSDANMILATLTDTLDLMRSDLARHLENVKRK